MANSYIQENYLFAKQMKQNVGKMQNHINRIRQKTRIPKLRYVFFLRLALGAVQGAFFEIVNKYPEYYYRVLR